MYPSEHKALCNIIDFGSSMTVVRNRPPRKRIGQWLRQPDQHTARVHDSVTGRAMMTMTDIAQKLLGAAREVPCAPRRRRALGTSPTEDALCAKLESARTTPLEREAVCHEMWQRRHDIAIEKSAPSTASILRDLRGGGWGGRHLSRSLAPMHHV